MQTLYTAHAKATGGRDGRATSSDGILDLPLAMPKELGGAGNATNPEQLFAAGYSACFLSALKLVASQQKLALPADARIEAAVSIGKADDGGFDIAVQLTAVLPGVDTAAATALIARTHQVCPYSRATHGNIAVTTELA